MGQAAAGASSVRPEPDLLEEGSGGSHSNPFVRLIDRAIPDEMKAEADVHLRARVTLGFALALGVLGAEAVAFFAWAIPGDEWQHVGLSVLVALGLTAGVPVAFHRLKSLALGANLVIGGYWLLMFTSFTVIGGIQAPPFHWCALMPMMAVLMGARRSAFVWAGVGMATVGAFTALDFVGLPMQDPAGLERPMLWVQRFGETGSWLAILLTVALMYEAQRRKQTQRLTLQNANLEAEILQRAQAEERIRYLAYYDELTTLPNRRLFEEHLATAIGHAQRQGRQVAVLFLDLDGFKAVNDTLGHETGDRLLEQVAERLRACVRLSDTVARGGEDGDEKDAGDVVSRRGGDEFTVLLSAVRDHREVAVIADRILQALAESFFLIDREISISASLGIALHSGTIGRFGCENLLRDADLAMYHAKECGKNNFQFFEDWMTTDTIERATLATELRRALDREEFELYYQPIVRPVTHECVGVEALARWHHPERGLVEAAEFIDVAEETGLTIQLSEWALRTAARDYAKWRSEGVAPQRIAVNVSGTQFRKRGLVQVVTHILSEYEIPPAALELEVDESTMIDVEEASRCLATLKDLGVSIALDDFGTGCSSLSSVRRFPVDRLKIDRSFVAEIVTDLECQAIVCAIMAMAGRLGLSVVAEGVETMPQESFLAAHGCKEFQGFLYARPEPAGIFAEKMRTGKTPNAEPSFPARKAESDPRR